MPFIDSVPPLSSNESKKDKPLIVGVACPIIIRKQDATLSPSPLPPRKETSKHEFDFYFMKVKRFIQTDYIEIFDFVF